RRQFSSAATANSRRRRGYREWSWTKSLHLKCCPVIQTPCCQHPVSSSKPSFSNENRHETSRPSVSDHPGLATNAESPHGGRDRGGTRDLEAHDLSRYRDPDRPARAD